MSRRLRVAVTSAALAVLVTAVPADAAWQTVGTTTTATLDTARLSAGLVVDGSSVGSTFSRSALLIGSSTTLLDVVNDSSVPTPVRMTLSSSQLLGTGVKLEECSATWSTGPCATGGQQLFPASGGVNAAGASGWVSPPLAVGGIDHLRLTLPASALLTTTVTVVPVPVARDRTLG